MSKAQIQTTEVTNNEIWTEEEQLKAIDNFLATRIKITGHRLNVDDLIDMMVNNQITEEVELQGENG